MSRAIGVLSIASPLAGLALVSFALAFTGTGCQHDQPEPLPERFATTQQVQEHPLTAPVQPTLIKQGLPPLVYMTESAATLRISDMDTNFDLATTSVGARQFVSVDARKGITVGQTLLVAGPLRAEHQYGIWLVPDRSSSIKTTTVQPIPERWRQPSQ